MSSYPRASPLNPQWGLSPSLLPSIPPTSGSRRHLVSFAFACTFVSIQLLFIRYDNSDISPSFHPTSLDEPCLPALSLLYYTNPPSNQTTADSASQDYHRLPPLNISACLPPRYSPLPIIAAFFPPLWICRIRIYLCTPSTIVLRTVNFCSVHLCISDCGSPPPPPPPPRPPSTQTLFPAATLLCLRGDKRAILFVPHCQVRSLGYGPFQRLNSGINPSVNILRSCFPPVLSARSHSSIAPGSALFTF